tara:strand:+ start:2532 stop:3869 length:1338 start_codon:yes stop_codon:yes gene_type:complete
MKLSTAIIGVLIIGGVGALIINNAQDGGDGAADFSGGVSTAVACEDIAATRGLVNTELAERKSAAGDILATEMEEASDNYWEKRRALEDAKTKCETDALLADPCKDLFERSSALADQILQNLDNGFDKAKFQEREQVKAEYDECLKNPPKEDTYPGKLEQCIATFNAGNKQALSERAIEEQTAQDKHDATVEAAEAAHASKMAALDALEKECEDTKYERKYGSLPGTGIPVTDYQGGSSACTGIFPGNDPDLQRRLSNLRSQYDKAKAAGNTTGFMGTAQLDQAIKELEAEMAAGDAKCTTDADCGGPVPVCCNINQIGRAFCSDGICANEVTACAAEEVCAGDPAQCLALIQVIEYQGSLIPTSQLRVGGKEEGCNSRHWHGSGTALDGTFFSDPAPDNCGFGTLDEKPAFSVYPPSQSSAPAPEANTPSSGNTIEIRGGIFGD